MKEGVYGLLYEDILVSGLVMQLFNPPCIHSNSFL
jgi:hypothetical protein